MTRNQWHERLSAISGEALKRKSRSREQNCLLRATSQRLLSCTGVRFRIRRSSHNLYTSNDTRFSDDFRYTDSVNHRQALALQSGISARAGRGAQRGKNVLFVPK